MKNHLCSGENRGWGGGGKKQTVRERTGVVNKTKARNRGGTRDRSGEREAQALRKVVTIEIQRTSLSSFKNICLSTDFHRFSFLHFSCLQFVFFLLRFKSVLAFHKRYYTDCKRVYPSVGPSVGHKLVKIMFRCRF